jgi:hypothetical protein
MEVSIGGFSKKKKKKKKPKYPAPSWAYTTGNVRQHTIDISENPCLLWHNSMESLQAH